VDRLEEDVAIGRRLAASAESGGSFLHGADPVAAVAAAAVVAAARGSASVASADLEWATQVLVDAALSPRLADKHDDVASRTWHLTDWLKDIRHAGLDPASVARWRRIVDGLASAGDPRAAELQAAEE
jgi:hypothetical protein